MIVDEEVIVLGDVRRQVTKEAGGYNVCLKLISRRREFGKSALCQSTTSTCLIIIYSVWLVERFYLLLATPNNLWQSSEGLSDNLGCCLVPTHLTRFSVNDCATKGAGDSGDQRGNYSGSPVR